jgi:hypothetical protein
MHMHHVSRRSFLMTATAACGCALMPGVASAHAASGAVRAYHVCLGSKVIEESPELLDIVRDAGVTDIWQAAFLYGHWYDTPEGLRAARARVEAHGLRWHLINVPLGHPGDSLGDHSGATPLTPPTHWRMATRPDGSTYSGTSLHPPGTAENVDAIQELAALKPDMLFLDDDFRLATGPGVIGGCFCDWHRERFLRGHGYTDARWEELLGDVEARRLTPLLRAWVDATCGELTASFHMQQAAAPDIALGNMIMYLGAEKAGIRLADYAGVPFRVGELMFDDASFGRVQGKTNELFSALFHRRFARPELAYSESTAYPADRLSARNMAAKLIVSTITDVRNTMYMSGLTPFPASHWEVLAPAMREQGRIHEVLKGHAPRGPFKHYWGEASRYVGNDQPFSLFLAAGIPFEVTGELATEGWTFLSDADAEDVAIKTDQVDHTRMVCRPGLAEATRGMRVTEESLEALWSLKREITAAGLKCPYVVDEKPVVCAWYPTADAVLLWNLGEDKETIRLQWDGETRTLEVGGLAALLVPR